MVDSTATDKTNNPPPLTKGEKLFNASTWWGVNGVAVWAASVGLTDYLMNGKGAVFFNKNLVEPAAQWSVFREGDVKTAEQMSAAKDALQKVKSHLHETGILTDTHLTLPDHALFEKGLISKEHLALAKEMGATGKAAHELAQSITHAAEYAVSRNKAFNSMIISSLFLGGCALLPVVKYLEDYKQPIVTKLDEWLTPSNASTQEKQQIEARHEYLGHEPHQTWGSILGGRAVVFAGVQAINRFVGPTLTHTSSTITNKMLYKNLEEQAATQAAGFKPEYRFNMMNKLEDHIRPSIEKTNAYINAQPVGKDIKTLQPHERIHNFAHLTVLDSIYTAATATSTYFAAKMLAAAGHNKEKQAPAHSTDTAEQKSNAKPTPVIQGGNYSHQLMASQVNQSVGV